MGVSGSAASLSLLWLLARRILAIAAADTTIHNNSDSDKERC